MLDTDTYRYLVSSELKKRTRRRRCAINAARFSERFQDSQWCSESADALQNETKQMFPSLVVTTVHDSFTDAIGVCEIVIADVSVACDNIFVLESSSGHEEVRWLPKIGSCNSRIRLGVHTESI